jgi:hypothetical protein
MQRKLISVAFRTFCRTLNATGTPEMKATSFLDFVARTPTCHSALQPGDSNALELLSATVFNQFLDSTHHLRNEVE